MHGFSFAVERQSKKHRARTGTIVTPHGIIKTPAFVPVGTQATVKSLDTDDLNASGVQLFFVNTYHMYVRPGMEVMSKFGGLHRFMGWQGPIITDSGGFQVFSLARPKYMPGKHDRDQEHAALVKIGEDGVMFRSHWDGSKHYFSPESSMQYQWILGSDIHIAFDECTYYPATHEYAESAMERTHRWARRSIAEHKKLARTHKRKKLPYQALYGVVQGGVYEDLRQASARFTGALDTDGIAIGGVSVGESKEEMRAVLSWVSPLLPAEKPRHLLGVGEIDDIFALVEAGVDTFDCVQPTRLARMGRLYVTRIDADTSRPHELDITHVRYRTDGAPIEDGCQCFACKHVSRAYIHHLFRVHELLGYRLATIHNLHVIESLVASIRTSIENDAFLELKKHWLYNS